MTFARIVMVLSIVALMIVLVSYRSVERDAGDTAPPGGGHDPRLDPSYEWVAAMGEAVVEGDVDAGCEAQRHLYVTYDDAALLARYLDAAKDPADKAEMKAAYQKKALKLRDQNRGYKAYCEETGLKTQDERLHVAGWDRKQAASAAGAARSELAKYSSYHYNEDRTIVVTDDWKDREHPRLPATYKPYAVVETVSQNEKKKQRNRTIYGPDARQSVQVHGGPHGNPKAHPFGINGEHAHRIIWEEDKIVSREASELTDKEREEHKDII